MSFSWESVLAAAETFAPDGTPKRKLLQILAIVVVFEGLSVLLLFSYVGAVLGIVSVVVGIILLFLFKPGAQPEAVSEEKRTPGLILIDYSSRLLGGRYGMIAFGLLLIVLVMIYNSFVSERPGIGDLDTLSLMLGGAIAIYPFLADKYKIEIGFTLLFLGLVVLFLVVPQVAAALFPSDGSSSVGNWYVHYMLAAPFAGILDLVGIPASSSGNSVTLQFQDGTSHTLGISAYCAGLYSFSIFLAAFFAFVLIFERLPYRYLAVVLALGLVVAYAGNLFRMVIIGVVGYYNGINALLWAHENVGWIVFLSWSAVFWYLLLGFVSKHKMSESAANEGN